MKKIFAYSPWDAVPALCGVLHFCYLLALFLLFPHLPLWSMPILGLIYSVSISWNINGIAHNFIHNPYFRWKPANKAFSWLLSVTMGFSQTLLRARPQPPSPGQQRPPRRNRRHRRLALDLPPRPRRRGRKRLDLHLFRIFPRRSQADLPRDQEAQRLQRPLGHFRDRLMGHPLHPRLHPELEVHVLLPPVLLLRPLPLLSQRLLPPLRRQPRCAPRLGRQQLPQALQLDLVLQRLPRRAPLQPRQHWTKMVDLHNQIREQQRKAGVRVIKPPHALGFLDPDLPDKSRPLTPPSEATAGA